MSGFLNRIPDTPPASSEACHAAGIINEAQDNIIKDDEVPAAVV
jgi:hypothetical protein